MICGEEEASMMEKWRYHGRKCRLNGERERERAREGERGATSNTMKRKLLLSRPDRKTAIVFKLLNRILVINTSTNKAILTVIAIFLIPGLVNTAAEMRQNGRRTRDIRRLW